MASETSVNSSSSYSVFGDVEHRLWRTLVAFMNRLPLRETTVTDNAPLRYEVEVRGFLPFKGCFDSKELHDQSFINRVITRYCWIECLL